MTLAEFDRDPEAAIDAARRAGRPIVLTRHGRFVAMVTPSGLPGAPGSGLIEEAEALLGELSPEEREVADQLLDDGFDGTVGDVCETARLVTNPASGTP